MIHFPAPPRLTLLQRSVLAALHRFHRGRGYPPAHDDLKWHVGTSDCGVHYSLRVLERRGLVVRAPDTARGSTLTPLGILAAQGYWPIWISQRSPAGTGGTA